MSTKEFDVAAALATLLRYNHLLNSTRHQTREAVDEMRAARLAVVHLLGPALDALSAARKERDEARDDALWRAWHRIATAMNAMCPPAIGGAYRGGMQNALRLLKDMGALAREGAPADPEMLKELAEISQSKPGAPPTIASLAERVKAIEERIDNQPKGQS